MTRTTPELAPPSPNFHATRLTTTYDLACNRPHTQWNRVSNLEPSGPKAETLPLGHRGPCTIWEKKVFKASIDWFDLRSLLVEGNRHKFVGDELKHIEWSVKYVSFFIKNSEGTFCHQPR
ncbi:hypothetical protein AVEN_121566-1 [Araneus ventricosus]|uniref:Uncharacterized protein n=1 Tax=Araneus ventricosus TaxID=182803 RepID=A0A4Y2GM35_ARAVE|nr:hypothetical protein AVEN_121566-1 [Araneus ventricosus]